MPPVSEAGKRQLGALAEVRLIQGPRRGDCLPAGPGIMRSATPLKRRLNLHFGGVASHNRGLHIKTGCSNAAGSIPTGSDGESDRYFW